MSVATTTETLAETLRLYELWLGGHRVVAHQGATKLAALNAMLVGANLRSAELREKLARS